MYLRYLAKYYDETLQQDKLGFFYAADYVRDNCSLSTSDRASLETSIKWFNQNLPIPEYYQSEKNRQDAKSATSWFKDSATQFINRMNQISIILEKHNVDIKRINSKKLLGQKIYEDNFQVTVNPYREHIKYVK
ncbi:MAG: hypothetical protein ACI9UR_001773 [Bacteroidia bacterium]|jgi:hypothetical protein